ncbi:FCD domain-containing protein [Allosaccharopolyspora coralli]|uniref:FCD domain-containing protein n=1 Tax=Allosaccharopolyspora coralli TaxID=2665642 RepID=A0A5Q3Q7M4_9PSEU|nr:GntR family transcriptional regulator [Allosaccharopolyspora coralli]QGK70482.1 FCD domain-containing protein [Allosaccharopolyspora coralli]
MTSESGRAESSTRQPQAAPLRDQAYVALRDKLVMLEIPPGAPIHEEEITSSLGLGRTPVRQALRRLEVERLVAIHPRRGTFAADVHITDLSQIAEIRLHLESQAAGWAAQRATQEERDTLRSLLVEMQQAESDDPAKLMELDSGMHRTIYQCAHNAYLEGSLTELHNLMARIWYLFAPRLPQAARLMEDHAPLVEAIIAGDRDKAQHLAARHVSDFESAVKAVL